MSSEKESQKTKDDIGENAETAGGTETAGAAEASEAADGTEAAEAAETSGEGEAPEQEDSQNTKYLRLMADFQNYKRRSEKEKADVYSYANEKLVGELLDVMDDFERALSHEADASGSYVEGMSMIFKNLKTVLERSGLEEIDALGADFDPNVHNAVMTSADSGFESGKICDVIQKGYKLNNKVIRPSMVKVAE
ncbi:MAG: nucleotide exchange factor GrpE [Clostridiales bacterium]|nr:nucleotide exchange factor GrpE [Clostridiales bacterium]